MFLNGKKRSSLFLETETFIAVETYDELLHILNSCLLLHPLSFDWQPAKVQALLKNVCAEAWSILGSLTERWRWTALLVMLSVCKGQAAYQANEKVKVKALGRPVWIVLISAQCTAGIKVPFLFECMVVDLYVWSLKLNYGHLSLKPQVCGIKDAKCQICTYLRLPVQGKKWSSDKTSKGN